jgi:hypothetical protein
MRSQSERNFVGLFSNSKIAQSIPFYPTRCAAVVALEQEELTASDAWQEPFDLRAVSSQRSSKLPNLTVGSLNRVY